MVLVEKACEAHPLGKGRFSGKQKTPAAGRGLASLGGDGLAIWETKKIGAMLQRGAGRA